jgi:D-glycerate 3-kinase
MSEPGAVGSADKAAYAASFTRQALAKGIELPGVSAYYDAVFEIAVATADSHAQGTMTTLGVGGAQGSGKSTIAGMLQQVLTDVFGLRTEVLSIDDFYLGRADRIKLGQRVHPMLAVRGVPGTHDMRRLRQTLEELASGATSYVPVFSKGDDDRLEQERQVEAPDVLVLEGWCWGAQPGPVEALSQPVNTLEHDQDPDGVWRGFVNDALASADYQVCFANDIKVFLAVPDMESVFRWRLQQEQQITSGQRVMDESEVRSFIMYYQRITQRMLDEQADLVDFTVQLAADHSIGSIRRRIT